MNTPAPKKSRVWNIVVATTAVAAVGGTSVAASWADPAAGTESISLSQQQSLAKGPSLNTDARAAVAKDFTELATRLGTWTGDSIPAVSSAFAKGRDLAAAQDVQSASVQSVQSVASVVSAQSVQSVKSAQSAQSIQSPNSPDSWDSPASVDSPPSVDSPNSPDSVDSPDN